MLSIVSLRVELEGGTAEGDRQVGKSNCFSLLPEEKERVVEYALQHASLRHRELAWKMVDDVAFVSPSTVYRVLKEEGPVAAGPRRKKVYHRPSGWASTPDEKWQTA